jgi:transcriptional regulator with XRE-family HTH domain
MTSTLPPNLNTQIGTRLRDKRKALHWTQKRLADEAHIDRSVISNIESGRVGPSAYTLRCLCVALQVSSDEVLGTGISADV